MNDFMYNKVMQLIEEKLQLELEIIRLKRQASDLESNYELKISTLNLEIAKLSYDNIKTKRK
jgi:hypothetical protein